MLQKIRYSIFFKLCKGEFNFKVNYSNFELEIKVGTIPFVLLRVAINKFVYKRGQQIRIFQNHVKMDVVVKAEI